MLTSLFGPMPARATREMAARPNRSRQDGVPRLERRRPRAAWISPVLADADSKSATPPCEPSRSRRSHSYVACGVSGPGTRPQLGRTVSPSAKRARADQIRAPVGSLVHGWIGRSPVRDIDRCPIGRRFPSQPGGSTRGRSTTNRHWRAEDAKREGPRPPRHDSVRPFVRS